MNTRNVFQMGDLIIIKHKSSASNSYEASELKGMTCELALWLDFKLRALEAERSGDFEALKGYQYALSKDQYLRDVIGRSILSANRGHNPKLSDGYDNLTNAGLSKAMLLRPIFDEINDEFDNIMNDPSQWHELDEMFIHVGIPIRVLKLLKMSRNAIAISLAMYKRELDQKLKAEQNKPKIDIQDEILDELTGGNKSDKSDKADKSDKPPQQDETPKTLEQIAKENETAIMMRKVLATQQQLQSATAGQNRPMPFLRMDELQKDKAIAEEVITTHTFKEEFLADNDRVWVPTAPFGQRERNYLNVLIKYGLIDLRMHRVEGQGRPKHIYRPSPIGHKVLKDLESVGLI